MEIEEIDDDVLEIELFCDFCKGSSGYEAMENQSVDNALAIARDLGWVIWQDLNNKWWHKCPVCALGVL